MTSHSTVGDPNERRGRPRIEIFPIGQIHDRSLSRAQRRHRSEHLRTRYRRRVTDIARCSTLFISHASRVTPRCHPRFVEDCPIQIRTRIPHVRPRRCPKRGDHRRRHHIRGTIRTHKNRREANQLVRILPVDLGIRDRQHTHTMPLDPLPGDTNQAISHGCHRRASASHEPHSDHASFTEPDAQGSGTQNATRFDNRRRARPGDLSSASASRAAPYLPICAGRNGHTSAVPSDHGRDRRGPRARLRARGTRHREPVGSRLGAR